MCHRVSRVRRFWGLNKVSRARWRGRAAKIVARGGGALRLDAQRGASRFLAVRSFEGAVEFESCAAAREVLEIGAALL